LSIENERSKPLPSARSMWARAVNGGSACALVSSICLIDGGDRRNAGDFQIQRHT